MSVASIAFYPPLSPGAYVRRPSDRLPYPLEDAGCELFSRGRHAIWQAAGALGLRPGDVALAPAWHHGAEIEALRRAGLGLAFYEPGPLLEPDAGELDGLLGDRVRMLVLTHYLGFPQDAARWRAWCDERGLLLFEDAAHACLARAGERPAGAYGDAAIWCLFKSFAVPDGAALRLRGAPPCPGAAGESGAALAARRHAQWLLQRAPGLAHAAGRGRSGRAFDLCAEIALGEPGSPPSAATMRLLRRVCSQRSADRRRANYAVLLEELRDQVPAPFDRLAPGAVPLGLPIRSTRKHALIERLSERGIDAVDFWSAPHPLLPAGRYAHTARLRESTVLLPVHQELRAAELERVADAARTRPRRHAQLRVQLAGAIADLRGEWGVLAQQAANVFATPEWTECWARHFLRGRPLSLLAFRSAGGRLVAVLPLYELCARPLRVLRVAGHGPGEDLGPVCAAADRVRVARALPGALDRLGAQLVLAEQISREPGWSALTGARVLRTEGSPVVGFDGLSWEELLGRRSRGLRKELRRQQAGLERGHAVRYRLGGGTPEELERDLDTLFGLHAARWRHDSRFLDDARFHRDFAAVARERGWLRLWFLEADGRAVAASYGFRYANVEFDYQGGRDPAWTAASVGLLLVAHSVQQALTDGVSEYRFLRGDEPYKYRFADQDPGLETFAIPRGPTAAAAAAVGAALPRSLAPVARRWLAP
jgi:dTDP-4-amino-4,6-dideoxygalactose transaminase/CelD/BcsL family acetyltransferase involved in cellulose biosynthesis